MIVSDILYLVFASVALFILFIYLIYLFKDDKKKQINYEIKYNNLISLLENIERNLSNEK